MPFIAADQFEGSVHPARWPEKKALEIAAHFREWLEIALPSCEIVLIHAGADWQTGETIYKIAIKQGDKTLGFFD